MAQRAAVAANERQPTGTITLLGHSAGGLVAWAAAQQLVDNGRPARVVLFDTYLVRGDVNIRIDDWGPAPSGMSRTRRIVRANRLRLASLKRRWWEHYPGAPRADPLRYMAFNHIMVRAFRRHEIKPARFPVLYLPVRHQSNPDEWHRLATNLTITTVDGDHQTMLDNQNVAKVASIITQWIDSPAGSAN
jgi:thioesterase domain-containing protein